MNNELILIVGRTGAGKSTIAKKIADMFDRPIVKSYTTRPMRKGETVETVDHIFIDAKDVFLYNDDFAAYTKIGNYEYFITWSLLERYASKGAIYVIDPIGVWNLQKSLKKTGKEINLKILYIKTDEKIRISRIKARGDTKAEIKKRLKAEEDQFHQFEQRIDDGYEKVLIIDNSVNNEKLIRDKQHSVFDGKPIIKSATLLSIEEAYKYLTQEERRYSNRWWLRSSGNNLSAAHIYDDDEFYYAGDFVYDDSFSVRPALEINLESSELGVGDTFSFGKKEFKIISDNLAFCLEDIGKHSFRDDWRAADANRYEKSDIKKFVDEWFEKAKKKLYGTVERKKCNGKFFRNKISDSIIN